MLLHVFVNVLVANSGLCILYAYLVKSSVQTEVGHYRGNDGIIDELSALLHVSSVDIEYVVACDDISLFINAETAVSVSVIGKARVQSLFHNELLEVLDMCGACVVVDICARGLCIYNIGLGAESVEYRLCNVPCRTVSAVQTYLHASE